MSTAFRSRPSGLRTARRQRQRLAAKALWACGAALAAGHAALAVWRMAELAQGPQPSSARVWATLGLTLASCFWPLACRWQAARRSVCLWAQQGAQAGDLLCMGMLCALLPELAFPLSPLRLQLGLPLPIVATAAVFSVLLLLYLAWLAPPRQALRHIAPAALLLPLGLTVMASDVNVGLDDSPVQRHLALVYQKRAWRVPSGTGLPDPSSARARVRRVAYEVLAAPLLSPGGAQGALCQWLPVDIGLYIQAQPDQPICLAWHAGALGARWLMTAPASACQPGITEQAEENPPPAYGPNRGMGAPSGAARGLPSAAAHD